MLIQFCRKENLIKVFKGRNSSALFVIKDAVLSHAKAYLGFKAPNSAWTKTEWGCEIELELRPVARPNKRIQPTRSRALKSNRTNKPARG